MTPNRASRLTNIAPFHVMELAKMAALAGMPRAQFDAAVRDEALARAIMEGV